MVTYNEIRLRKLVELEEGTIKKAEDPKSENTKKSKK